MQILYHTIFIANRLQRLVIQFIEVIDVDTLASLVDLSVVIHAARPVRDKQHIRIDCHLEVVHHLFFRRKHAEHQLRDFPADPVH